MDSLRAALDPDTGRPDVVGGQRDHPRDIVAAGRSQLRHHGFHHARRGYDLLASASIRVGNAGDVAARLAGDAGADRRPGVDRDGPYGRNALLLRLEWWRSDPVAEHVLVLFPPGRLHHGPTGDGDCLRGLPRLLPQADLRLQ